MTRDHRRHPKELGPTLPERSLGCGGRARVVHRPDQRSGGRARRAADTRGGERRYDRPYPHPRVLSDLAIGTFSHDGGPFRWPCRVRYGSKRVLARLAPHAFRNAADVPARLLCTAVPAGLEAFFAEFGDRVASRTSPPPAAQRRGAGRRGCGAPSSALRTTAWSCCRPSGVSALAAARRCRAGRRRAHVVAHRRQQAGEGLDVVARERLEEQVLDDLDVAGEHLREPRAAGVGDRDRDAPLVVGGGGARDQARLLEQAGLVGQARCGCRRRRRPGRSCGGCPSASRRGGPGAGTARS